MQTLEIKEIGTKCNPQRKLGPNPNWNLSIKTMLEKTGTEVTKTSGMMAKSRILLRCLESIHSVNPAYNLLISSFVNLESHT